MTWAAPGIGAFTLAVVLVILSTVFVALRFVSRRRILNIWGATDWFMLVTLVGAMKQDVAPSIVLNLETVLRFCERRHCWSLYVGRVYFPGSLTWSGIACEPNMPADRCCRPVAAYGMGHHVVDLRPDQLPPFVKVRAPSPGKKKQLIELQRSLC